MKHPYLLFLLLLGVCASCSKDPEPETPPASTFSVRIDNVVQNPYFEDDPERPFPFVPYLVMSDLPEDEKLLAFGGYYSPENPDPDESDYAFFRDYSDYELIQEWDWSVDLIYSAAFLDQLIPGKTYYFKGVVKTDRGTYYSNVVRIDTNGLPDYREDPQARVLPVVFHVMPYRDGTYPHAYFFEEMLSCANRMYQNVWKMPGQADAGVRFVPVTHAPDGSPLPVPGVHYLEQCRELDRNMSYEELKRWVGGDLWNMTEAINVWVSPFFNDYIESEALRTGGFTYLPYFDRSELLEGCNLVNPGCFSGIFLNQIIAGNGYGNAGVTVFAHEAGHYLGLCHVFEEDWCEDTPQYDRARYLAEQYGLGMDIYMRYPLDASEPYVALNVMDYDGVIYTGITPQQAERIRYTLQYAYLVPGGRLPLRAVKGDTGREPQRIY